MKVRIGIVFLVFFVSISCVKSQTEGVTLVDVPTFEQKMEEQEVQLIDVRTPDEFASGHLANAVNININDTDFKAKMEALDKTKPVLVYCKSGGRSGRACGQLKEMGFTSITDLDGGITDWKAKGKPVEN
ncbi:rhodanese-like domain-containing protein [Flavobacterium jejuense]|uniref:Rhodanese-like domain-containing protein n=1 Tax=Flavobacterium jejuense TaxID=1544455 RepID=A0ABX0IR56_9FLAO|nr:rhodanese-like domain-containing protein [Flavobacterium jejuense]NHN24611.1 rhodanese-like domain-containing protein [Flavobacterium jejuense]